MRNAGIASALLLSFFSGTAVVRAQTPVSSCRTITAAGSYVITQNITNTIPPAPVCIDIRVPNVTLDCDGFSIADQPGNNGTGIQIASSDPSVTIYSVAVRNCRVTGFGVGIYAFNGLDHEIKDNVVTSNSWDGILLEEVVSSTVSYNVASQNGVGTGFAGIDLMFSNYNTIEGNQSSSNDWGVILGLGSSGNELLLNRIALNGAGGIFVPSPVALNTIYNNLFNNANNFQVTTTNINTWTTPRAPGVRVFGGGNEIGGNYWTNPTSSGPSDTCQDVEPDGFCDTAVVLGTNNTDTLPLSNRLLVSCPFTLGGAGIYRLLNDLGSSATCLTINATDVVVDCSGFRIVGQGVANSVGIDDTGFARPTVRDCSISNFGAGIRLSGATSGTIDSNTIDANTNGIQLVNASGHTVQDNVVSASAVAGIVLNGAQSNLFFNNLLRNGINVSFAGSILPNTWNTVRQPGTRIYAPGPEIGGNYWSTPVSSGYSDICTDVDTDGFCDAAYGVPGGGVGNIDYLAMSDEYPPNAITVCPTAINAPGTYTLRQNVTSTGTCLMINAADVVVDCGPYGISGTDADDSVAILNSGYPRVTVENCTINDFWVGVLYWNGADGGRIQSNTITSAVDAGVYLNGASDNEILDNTLLSNGVGIEIWNASNSNALTGNAIEGSDQGILIGLNSVGTGVVRNVIRLGYEGIALDSPGSRIYNNYLENSVNVWLGPYAGANEWNTTRQPGDRVYDVEGVEIGGNYWLDADRYSEDCDDAQADGFCDSPYTIGASNVDSLPLSDAYDFTEISSCPYSISSAGNYGLSQDLEATGTCLTVNAGDVVLDCAGYAIRGTDGTGYGVVNSGFDNVTVAGCDVSGFDVGIFYTNPGYNGADDGWIYGNRLSSNRDGIKLYWCAGNNVANNTTSGNTGAGIALTWFSNGNTLSGNVADLNPSGLWIQDSSSNVVAGNDLSSNRYGTYLYSAYASNNQFSGNTIRSNTESGVRIDFSGNNSFANDVVSDNALWDFTSGGWSVNTATDLTVGPNVLSFTGLDVSLKSLATGPADPPGYRNIGRYVEAVGNSESSWLNLDIRYLDDDVPAEMSESSLRIWRNSGTWTDEGFFTENGVDTVGNVVFADITSFGSLFAPLGYTGTCWDDTPLGQCSAQQPLYCSATDGLIPFCQTCGCQSDLECIADGTCVAAPKPERPRLQTQTPTTDFVFFDSIDLYEDGAKPVNPTGNGED